MTNHDLFCLQALAALKPQTPPLVHTKSEQPAGTQKLGSRGVLFFGHSNSTAPQANLLQRSALLSGKCWPVLPTGTTSYLPHPEGHLPVDLGENLAGPETWGIHLTEPQPCSHHTSLLSHAQSNLCSNLHIVVSHS